MTFLKPRLSSRQSFGTHVRAWLRRRRDLRILESLGEEQLKDIGFRRLPTGDFGPREW